MNHPACSAPDIENREGGVGRTVALCVIHLIAGVGAGLAVLGALAVWSAMH